MAPCKVEIDALARLFFLPVHAYIWPQRIPDADMAALAVRLIGTLPLSENPPLSALLYRSTLLEVVNNLQRTDKLPHVELVRVSSAYVLKHALYPDYSFTQNIES